LICIALPAQTYAHTQERQKTESVTAKKKVAHAKIHHQQKKGLKQNHKKTTVPLHEKKKLVEVIIGEHQFALTMESLKTGIPTSVLVGIIAQESAGDTQAIGTDGKGSIGLGQTTPIADKASNINCNSLNPICSIKKIGGYLRHLQLTEKIVELPEILIGYNRGPKGLKKFKGTPENDSYVRNVLSYALLARKSLQEEPMF
jgi:hypothetical protein